jgi:hypothetical protein
MLTVAGARAVGQRRRLPKDSFQVGLRSVSTVGMVLPMTTRSDHTDCSHDATPKGRAWCRNMRNQAIKKAQQAYTALWTVETPDQGAYDEYYALVDDVAYRLGVEVREAYTIVEDGPVAN